MQNLNEQYSRYKLYVQLVKGQKKKCNVARSLKTYGIPKLEIFIMLLKIFSKG